MALEVSHLVTNGCSYTYCTGLYDPPNEGWPRLLAKKLGIPVVNLGVQGSSNDGIHRRTYDYFYKNLEFNSKPLFIIAMTESTRYEMFVSEYYQDYKTFLVTDNCKLSNEYYSHITSRGICLSEARKLRHWASIINLFDLTKTPFVTSDYIPDNTKSVIKFVKEHYNSLSDSIKNHPNTLQNFSSITESYPRALDDAHDGPEAQVVLAEYVYNQLIKRYGEIIPIKTDYLSLKDFPTQPVKRFNKLNQWYLHEIGKEYSYGLT